MNGFFFILAALAFSLIFLSVDSGNKERDRQYKCFMLTKDKLCFNDKEEK